jgi:tetratricopeptide (TPR) repeat protein
VRTSAVREYDDRVKGMRRMLHIETRTSVFDPNVGLLASCRSLTASLAILIGLAGCTTTPPPPPHFERLLRDDLFAAPPAQIEPSEIFAVSEPMKEYLRTEISSQAKSKGLQGGLVAALYSRGQLKLEYDSSQTRTAAEAFDARAGNCLSLVVMTAAFAKELGLQIRYQSAYREETWSRTGNLLLRAGHVNITLGPKLQDRASRVAGTVTIDFLPSHEARNLRATEISEDTIVAMFMNNRAVEAIVRGEIDDAYAWTRASLLANPRFLAAYNTLGILYARRGHSDLAESAFRQVLEIDPKHTRAMANLAEVYASEGREEEAAALRTELARLEPEPPLELFNLGMLALQRHDYRAARELFGREAARSGYSTEVSFWLGVALYRMGEYEQASVYLDHALESSTKKSDRELYSAKLAHLKNSVH